METQLETGKGFALCIDNSNCGDLEVRKVYLVIPDENAAKDGYLRVIDESGQDYLYPESYFVLIDLPQEARNVCLLSQR